MIPDVYKRQLYRIAGRPETDNTALPADYENEEFNAAHPYYNAICWAYQARLLRQNDPNTECDDKVDYQTACVLIRRYAIMAGVDTDVDQTQLRQLLRDAPDLNREAAKAMLCCDSVSYTHLSARSAWAEMGSSISSRSFSMGSAKIC